MYVGQQHAHEQWTDILHPNMKPVIINKDGYGNFGVQGMSASVWVDSATAHRDNLKRDLYVYTFHSPGPLRPDTALGCGLMANFFGV